MANHLTLEERDRIAECRHRGADQKEIAAAIGRSRATISRELRRNAAEDSYYAAQTQRHAERRRERPLVRKMDDPQLNEAVRTRLTQEWSPAQIAGRLEQEHPDSPMRRVSAQTIYAWIEWDQNRLHWRSFLRRRSKRACRRKKPETGLGARIHNRPEVIEQRLWLGDFEGDTVASSYTLPIRAVRISAARTKTPMA